MKKHKRTIANEVKINVPEGYEIDKENSTFECIKFKPIENELPKTLEEFCEKHPIKDEESYLVADCIISTSCAGYKRESSDTGYLPNKETAEAMLALCQLIQLRDCYNCGWKPNWRNDYQKKYIIYVTCNNIASCAGNFRNNHILSFKTGELRDQFLENFRDLIETAKPLL